MKCLIFGNVDPNHCKVNAHVIMKIWKTERMDEY